MTKRKQASDNEEDSSSDVDLVDVSFEFFDPNPNVDYHAIKRLLTQLFQRDAEQLHLHELTELVLAQPTVGTTIKTDGIESDPYALLTVLNMHLHHENASIKAIANYLLAVTAQSDPAFHTTLNTLFSQPEPHVGLVLCERLVNMPVQVIPPMYNMLADEVKWALGDGEPYRFSHLIVLSRVYHLTPEEESILANSTASRRSRASSSAGLDASSNGRNKNKKARSQADQVIARPDDGIYFYHPEDDIITKNAIHSLTYPYNAPPPPLVQESRSRDSFGLDIRGRVMIVAGGEETLRNLGGQMLEVYGRG